MGQTLTYELGRANIGRIVKVIRARGKPGATVARLVGAFRHSAEVVPKGHGQTELVEWRLVRDYTSGNRGPLAVPEDTQTERNV